MTSRTRRLLVLCVLAAGSASALGVSVPPPDVDLELRGKDKVRTTLRPASEVDSFLCDLPRGTVISASARSKGKTAPAPHLAFQSGGDDVTGAVIVPKGTTVALKPFTVATTGQY